LRRAPPRARAERYDCALASCGEHRLSGLPVDEYLHCKDGLHHIFLWQPSGEGLHLDTIDLLLATVIIVPETMIRKAICSGASAAAMAMTHPPWLAPQSPTQFVSMEEWYLRKETAASASSQRESRSRKLLSLAD